MPPIILHQAKECSHDIHYNIPLEYIVNHTPSGYMDRYGWLKSMTQFSNVCGASPVNNKILFFDGYGSHFDDDAPWQVMGKNTQSFVLKEVDYINDQLNDNGPNYKLNSL